MITILQSVLLLRLPIVQGPYAGSFAALLAVGHLQGGGLGAAYGSFFVASLIWCVLTVPIRRFSFIGLFARFLRAPIISGMMVMLMIIQIAERGAAELDRPARPARAFPLVNILTGAVAVAVLIVVTLWGGRASAPRRDSGGACRRHGVLRCVPADFLCGGMRAPWLVTPHWFPFGFGVRDRSGHRVSAGADPAGMGSMAMYQMVADWGDEKLPAERMAQGFFGVALGSVLAAIVRRIQHHRVSRQYRHAAGDARGLALRNAGGGVLLIALGGFIKFDMLLVLVPQPVVSAAATLLFGIVFMHGVQMLAKWIGTTGNSSWRGLRFWWGWADFSSRPKPAGHAAAGEACHPAAGDFRRTHAGDPALATLLETCGLPGVGA